MISMILSFLLTFCLLSYLFVRSNDQKLARLPPEAATFSPARFTVEEINSVAKRIAKSPILVTDRLPPRTGRKYIVVGGAGFLGGWIVRHLLERGESPRNIRVLDIRLPTRRDLTTGDACNVHFMQVDITDADAVKAAFAAPWPTDDAADLSEITVFHTAANIRFHERHPSLLPFSAKVNVAGTINVLAAARAIGVSILIYTSSGSITVHRSRFWLWPWQKEPDYFVQVLTDGDEFVPTQHDQFFSNYAVTKRMAESEVRRADRTPSGASILRTGCIRPGNGVFGPGGDVLCGAYLIRRKNPTWMMNVLQSFIYVENCSLAHLCYERRLLDTIKSPGVNPDLGGDAFIVTDPGPPATFGDIYLALNTLSHGETTFPILSPTTTLAIAHVVELYYLARHFALASSVAVINMLGRALPPVEGDIVTLQPSLHALVNVHLIFDSSRACLPPERGGLGYEGAWTTLEGLCKLVEEHYQTSEQGEKWLENGGVSLRFGLVRAERGLAKLGLAGSKS